MAASKVLGEDSARVVGGGEGGWTPKKKNSFKLFYSSLAHSLTLTTAVSVGGNANVNANAVTEPETEVDRGGVGGGE